MLISGNRKVSSEVELLVFVIYQKKINYYAKYFQLTIINLWNSDIHLVHLEAKLFYKAWPYYIDLAT